jgi:hypothetical protein
MNSKDLTFAQNWIEQFRKDRADFIGSDDYYDFPEMAKDPFIRDSGGDALTHAFTWRDTAEGDNVWRRRRDSIDVEMLVY